MPDNGLFAYVSNSRTMDIFVLQLDPESGEATPVQQVSVTRDMLSTAQSMPMAVSPDRRFLYAALRTEPYAVASFAIDPLRGQLTHLVYAPLPDTMAYISTDQTGRFLFGTSVPESKRKPRTSLLSVSAIGPHGFVQPAHQIVRTAPKVHAILPDPSNRYVFATSCDGDFVLGHPFDATTGMLSLNELSPVRVKANAGPRHFVFHPNNRFLYLLNETDASIYTFAYDARSGALSELQIVSALPPDFQEDKEHPGAHAADVHLTPDGRFLYASVRASHTLAAFKVDLANGILAPVANFPTPKGPRGFNIDPYGRYLLAAGRLSHSMTSYSIDRETGNLTRLKDYAMGKGPNWIEIVRLP